MESLVTKHSFFPRREDVHQRLILMKGAVIRVQKSDLFKELLTLILGVGNYMNGNTIAGGAFGFKINSLPKVIGSLITNQPSHRNYLCSCMNADHLLMER